jgi:hypothetical protein
MVARHVLKAFTAHVDGRGYAGDVTEFNAPELALKTEEFRAGGMAAGVDINQGMEKLVADMTLTGTDPNVLALFGMVEGQFVPVVLRESLESYDGVKTGVTHTMRGKLIKVEQGTSKPGEAKPQKYSFSLNYYKMQHGDRVVHEIDVINMVHIVDGVDVLAEQRSHLGI